MKIKNKCLEVHRATTVSTRIDQINRSIVFNSPGSVTSPTPVTLFAKADSGIATKPKLSLPVVPRLAIETGVNVVGTEPRSLQWPLHLHLNGSFKQMPPKQAGGIVSGCDNKGVWSEEEKMFHINVLELDYSYLCRQEDTLKPSNV